MNLFELFATITLDDSGYKKGLDEAANHTSKFGESLKNGLATAAKIGTASITAAATGIAALTKASVQNYANQEQLVGGVDTLFKESSQKVQEYAANAYKTAGMSANEYMETVTSFSASLLQSLEGDTEAATEAANQAIVDMSDNANKMGTDISLIQNAYQGFAKQNYSMLDNLKLGYGGTASEMHRLLEDAAAMNEEFAQTAEYSMDEKGHLEVGYADVLKAINIVQTEMGITGTTAKEASETISGSMAAAKAAWSNLVTGIADENADFNKLINNFVNSVSTAAKNLVPRVKTAITGIGQLISQTLPIIVNEIPAIIKDVVPDLLNAAMDLVSAIGQGLLDNADSLLSSALDLVAKLGSFLVDALPNLANSAVEIVVTLGNKIAEAAPNLITGATTAITKLAELLTNPEQLGKIFNAGLQIITEVGKSLIDNVGEVTKKVPDIIQNVVDFLTNTDSISNIINAGTTLMTTLLDNVDEIVGGLMDGTFAIIDGIINFLVGENGGESGISKMIDAGFKLVGALFENVDDLILEIAPKVVEFGEKLINKIKETDWLAVGGDIAGAIWDGLESSWNTLVEGVDNLWNEFQDWLHDAQGVGNGIRNHDLDYDTIRSRIHMPTAEEYPNTPASVDHMRRYGYTPIVQYNYYGNNATLADTEKTNMQLEAALGAR